MRNSLHCVQLRIITMLHPQLAKHQLTTILVLLLTTISMSSVSSLGPPSQKSLIIDESKQNDNTPEYKYIITINPRDEKAVDDEMCHPPKGGGNSSVPCRSLNYAFQQFQNLKSVQFYLDVPNLTYSLNLTTSFTNGDKIGIFGNSNLYPVLPIVECEPDVGLTFVNSNNIMFDSVQFLKCSAPQDSTSKKLTSKQSVYIMLIVKVGLYFYNCTNVSMHQVSVMNGTLATGIVMYDVDGEVEVSNCNFTGHSAGTADRHCIGHGGGGFAVEFTYCRPGDNKCTDTKYNVNNVRRNKNASYLFLNSTFHNNFACGQSFMDYGGRLLSSNSSHQGVGRGGGLSFSLKGDAMNNVITVVNCQFNHNHAVWGGGLFVTMEDNAINNIVKISDCLIMHNHAFIITEIGTGGGGIYIGSSTYLWNHVQSDTSTSNGGNKVYVKDCNFTRSHALQGGAIFISLPRQNGGQYTEISVSHCSFDGNRAQLGAALYVGIYPAINEGIVPQVVFDSCSFVNNSIEYHNGTIHTVGIGTIYVNEVPVTFQNQVDFINNTGSALGIVGAQANFTRANALFLNNSGQHGAGIALLGTASILVGETTTMNFTGNYATRYGGAIYKEYIIREDLKSSLHCFIRYARPFIEPPEWTASFLFLNNTADILGHAIFSSAILPCSFGSNSTKKIFCWNESHWKYGNSNCTDQIFTRPQKFSVNETSLSTPIDAYPGHQFQLPLVAMDDLGHNVTNDSVYYAFISNSSAKVEPGFNHIASNYISIAGSPGDHNITLVMQTESSRMINVKLDIAMMECPPGFNTTLRNNVTICACLPNLTYEDYLKCFSQEFRSYIQVGKWLGKVDGKLLMGTLPLPYRQATKNSYRELPVNRSELDVKLCRSMKRTDVLCGRCVDGYAVAVNSPKYECVPCRSIPTTTFVGNLFAYIALTYGSIFALFLAIIFLNFKLTSSAAMGFVLYAQMVGSDVFSLTRSALVSSHHYQRIEIAYTTIYGIFNLKSLSFLMKPFCLNPNFNTLDVICLDYAIAGFPLVMIAMIYFVFRCTSRCHCPRSHRRTMDAPDPSTSVSSRSVSAEQQPGTSNRNTLVHAFSAFMFLSYTKFCLASMKTMAMYELIDAQGNYVERRIGLAGHWRFTDHQFLFPYGIVAIFAFIFAVLLPPFLLLGPIQLIDWLIEKPRFNFLRKVWPSIAIHTILDTFQGFYRPGCRFFGGVFVLFRLVVFISYSFAETIDQHYTIQQIAVVVLICLIAMFRPYTSDFHNHVNILIFLNLSILNTFAIFMYANSTMHFSTKVYTLQCILVWLPLIYIICYAIWRRIHQRESYQKVKDKVRKRFSFRLVNPITQLSDASKKDEGKHLIKSGNPADDDDIAVDHAIDNPDEGMFQRAAQKNRFLPSHVQNRSRNVTFSEVSGPHCPELKAKEELSTGDSSADTGTGGSSGIDMKYSK